MIIPEGFAQVNFRFTGPPMPNGGECTLGLDLVTQPSFTPVDVATSMYNNWVAQFLPAQVENLVLAEVYCKFGPNDVGPAGSFFGSADGVQAGEADPPNVAFLLRKGTNTGGRRGRGRMYVPGFPEDEVSQNGEINAPFLGTINGFAATFMSQMTTDGLAPVLLHAPGNTITPPPTPITSLSFDSKVATQRRRLRR